MDGLSISAMDRRLHHTLFPLLLTTAALLVTGCAVPPAPSTSVAASRPIAERVRALPPLDVLLLGEQHDAPAHQQIEAEVVQALAAEGRLAALAIEMAEDGHSSAKLPADASEAQVRRALHWQDAAWPWRAYGPVVMAAVHAGVPVLGANLPRAHMKNAMADVSLDAQLSPPALQQQQAAVRDGHCGLLPASRIQPMTRIQVARDRSMAQVLAKAQQPGKTVLLVTGNGHARRSLGVAQHLPDTLRVQSIGLLAAASVPDDEGADFDQRWLTPPLPPQDHCAPLRK